MNPDRSIPAPPVPLSAEPQIAAPVHASLLPTPPEKLLVAPRKTSWGALIGIVIILAVLVVSALYFWGAQLAEREAALESSSAKTDIETRN